MKKSIKAEIARRNGALSHGNSSPNPKRLCTQAEDDQALHALTARWIAKLQPRDEAELELVHEIAAHRWRMTRSWSIETAALDTEMDTRASQLADIIDNPDTAVRLADAWTSLSDRSTSIETLGRYEFRLRRQFERALSDYLRLRAFTPAEDEPALLEIAA